MLTLDLEKKNGKVKEAKVDAMGPMSSPGHHVDYVSISYPSMDPCPGGVSVRGLTIGSVNSVLFTRGNLGNFNLYPGEL